MIPIRWKCDACGETEEIEVDSFATLQKIIQDVGDNHKNLSPYCESQDILVGVPMSYMDPDHGYRLQYTNGHSDEEIPVEGEG